MAARSVRLVALALLVLVPATLSACYSRTEAIPTAKVAHGSSGMVVTSTPYATAAGVQILKKGGNAVDAAVAAAFALMVSDPPMTSLGGRVQIMMVLKDGRVIGVDGATRTPGEVPPLASCEEDDRSGHQLAPVPGNPAALSHVVGRYGKLSFAEVLEPAIELAEEGFAVTRAVAAIWERQRDKLAKDPGAAANYLKQDGSPYKAGEIFQHPRLGQVLRALAGSGTDIFYRGWIADTIARDMEANGGFIRKADLEAYQPQPAVIDRLKYGDYEIVMAARHARGSTLAEMLRTLGHFPLRQGEPTPEEAEVMVRTIAETFADRPSIVEPIAPTGPQPDVAAADEFAHKRADRVREGVRKPLDAPSPAGVDQQKEAVTETTHLSVIDAEGNAVALTTSIGPVFGAGVASPELGFLYAHSYRMDTRPLPHSATTPR
jgi:gamma-glutamyltranspeptidase/glutathione hydrolase